MKKILFATTATAALAVGGMASAQGISLFGDARLGLGYKVDSDGDVQLTEDDVRAISRVRFGVNMTGETNSGITFGASIRADNSGNGEQGDTGRGVSNQTAGDVFVSGAFGTLTYGDIDEAHQSHVGDLPELGLTGLGFFNELDYLGNRVNGSEYRPTVRYDYDLAGFGLSLSTGGELDSIGAGASYTFQFGGGSFTAGGGYFDGNANDLADDITTDDEDESDEEPDNSQWAAGLSGEFAGFSGQVLYTTTEVDGLDDDVEDLGLGIGTTFADVGVNGFYRKRLEDGSGGDDDAYGVDVTYDLGGGASVKGGVVRTYEVEDEDGDIDNETIADFGISMAF